MAALPGVDLSFKQLVNAILYKSKYAKDQLAELSESELDSLDRKLQIAASAVRGCRNSSQKINRLPPELLLHILEEAQMHLTSFLPDLTAYEDHGREWYSLLHVCRQWRGIIARSPTLWSTIDNTLVEDAHNSVAHERYLYRSGGAPLIVYLGVKDTKIRRKSLQALLKHVSRFKELHLIADLWEDSSTPIYTLLVDPAPTLCSLTLRTDGKDVVGGVLPPIFAGEMPRLRELTLEHFTSWPTNYFHNLTSLSLSDQPFHRPTTQAFLDFLENSPMLEILALVRAGPTLPSNTDILPTLNRIVRFPHMRQINLGGWPTPSTISRFLSYISLPSDTDVYIWGSIFSNPDMDLPSLLPSDTTHLDNIQGITKWYLTHYSVAQPGDLLYVPFTAIVGSGSSHALHNYGVFRASQLVASLARYPSMHNITEFVLRDSSYQANRFTTAVWVEIFGRLKGLERLRILAYQSTTTTRSVLTALLPVLVKGGKGKDVVRVGEDDESEDGEIRSVDGRPSTSTHYPSSSEKSSLTPRNDEDHYQILCPKLSALGIEHDPDLASIFITKLVKSRARHGCPISSLIILVYDPQYGVAPSSPRDRSTPDPNPNHHHHHHHHHNGAGANANGNGNANPNASSSSISSRDILNEEYNLRSREDEELLRRYVKGEVKFEYKKPLSQDLVPKGWPTDAYRRTCLPYSF